MSASSDALGAPNSLTESLRRIKAIYPATYRRTYCSRNWLTDHRKDLTAAAYTSRRTGRTSEHPLPGLMKTGCRAAEHMNSRTPIPEDSATFLLPFVAT